ncbi:MAG: hypothetical protein BYD32DRAFT_424675 [Podila humilis]|nr:MAG: hypothetical protein BYD32DRAFT_424675 [Podila humilis]
MRLHAFVTHSFLPFFLPCFLCDAYPPPPRPAHLLCPFTCSGSSPEMEPLSSCDVLMQSTSALHAQHSHWSISVEGSSMENEGTTLDRHPDQLDDVPDLNHHYITSVTAAMPLANTAVRGADFEETEQSRASPAEAYEQEHQDTQQQPQDPPDSLPSPITSPQPLRLPSLSLSARSSLGPQAGPIFSTADDPPPYSPTHTILPHYFSLEPIPVRTYIIKDSDALPSLLDFWLCASAPTSRPQSPTMVQQRGTTPTHHNELKYSVIRPLQTDRTAIPVTSTAAPNAYFIPALALIAADHPGRWIWWGTEALTLVVFGRQLKNIIMEWKWKVGRARIGGPLVQRLIGCSFRVTPEREYCWKLGTGRQRGASGHGGRHRNRDRQSRERRHNQVGDLNDSSRDITVNRGGGWFGSFFSSRSPTMPDSVFAMSDVVTDVRVAIPPAHARTTTNTEHEGGYTESDDDDDGELGAYHCREYGSDGITGRIVAIYRPGRPANRARDRQASSRKLEVFSEVGERCETALMMMCVRIDDLFMSIPDQKKGPFATLQSEEGSGRLGAPAGSSRDTSDEATDRDGGGQQSQASMLRRLARDGRAWKPWIKWIIAAVLIAVVVILVLKPKLGR